MSINNPKYFNVKIILTIFIGFAIFSPTFIFAREFRQVIPIGGGSGNVPNSSSNYASQGPIIKPLESKVIDTAVKKVFDSYNTPAFAEKLSSDFYDASRLNDAITESIPRDAKLRVLAIRNSHVLSQTMQPSPDGNGNQLVSNISVTVESQLEFNNANGFQQRQGTNELILQITQKVSP